MTYLLRLESGGTVRVEANSEREAVRLAGLAGAAGATPAQTDGAGARVLARHFCRCGQPILLADESVCRECGRLHCWSCDCERSGDA